MTRIALLLAGVLHLSPALAAERLPLTATYGDAGGCQMLKDRTDGSLDGIFLTATEHGGLEWSCSFSWIGGGENFGGDYTAPDGSNRPLLAWSVIALCGGEGMAWPDVFAVEDKGDAVAVSMLSEPAGEPIILKQCP